MKKVMLLGAGSGQLPFLNICKSKGYFVIVVSVAGNYPCFERADKSYFVDTRNKEEILKIALAEKIDAIMTDQTDVSVPTVAYVAEKMNLRGIGYETSLKFTNKYLMRQAARNAGVAVPDFDKASTLTDAKKIAAKIGYPVIIKPVDSSGSRGVIRLDSEEDLIINFDTAKNFSLASEVIIEKFIRGKEYLVDGYAMNYGYWNLDLGIKEQFDLKENYVSKMCMFSSLKLINNNVGKLVLETNKKLVKEMHLKFGITHAEYLYNYEDNRIYLVEIAARGGGVYLSSDLTPLASGFNTNVAIIDYLVEGKETFINIKKLDKKVAAWICFAFPEGEIIEINGLDALKKINGVHKIIMDDVYIGKKTKTLTSDSEKYGPILIYADSENECYEVIKRVKDTLKIKIQTVNGIENQIW